MDLESADRWQGLQGLDSGFRLHKTGLQPRNFTAPDLVHPNPKPTKPDAMVVVVVVVVAATSHSLRLRLRGPPLLMLETKRQN